MANNPLAKYIKGPRKGPKKAREKSSLKVAKSFSAIKIKKPQ